MVIPMLLLISVFCKNTFTLSRFTKYTWILFLYVFLVFLIQIVHLYSNTVYINILGNQVSKWWNTVFGKLDT